MTKKAKRVLILLIPVAAGAVFFFGPTIIHAFYRVETSKAEIKSNEALYHVLASKEAFDKTISQSEREWVREERMRLFYWFHARGLNIDEGWHESAFGEKRRHWRELFEYWSL